MAQATAAATHNNHLKKIAIVGPESSGKTFLAEKLAAHYRCVWVPEYAREYLEKFTQPYTKEDVEKIARGQLAAEDAAVKRAGSLLICDTNLLVIKIWMEHKYNDIPKWIEEEILKRKYDLHLLTAPDIPYEYDPLRENPERGEYFFEKYKLLLEELNLKYAVIFGNEKNRFESGVKAINRISHP